MHGEAENKDYKKILENFVADNPELERLEEILDKFNIFAALELINYEIRHSTFLAWLLNPTESHGLKDTFLKIFLKNLAVKASALGIEGVSVFDLDMWDLDNSEVMKEWQNIDIIIKSDEHKFLCLIENKLNTKEHSDQLKRYKNFVDREFPLYKKFYVYLTPEGDTPSEENYIPLSYGEISAMVEYLIENKKNKMGNEILIFITHYKDMLRRYIMKNSEIQELCRKIYQKHKRALDLIFEYKPDRLLEIYQFLIELIENDADLILDDSSKSYVRFISRELDFIPKEGSGWTKSKRILLFEFQNSKEGLSLNLIIGPGNKEIREEIYNKALEYSTLFEKTNRKLSPQWFTIYKKNFLNFRKSKDKDIDEIKQIILKKFNSFKSDDLPKIEEKLIELKGKFKNSTSN